MISDYVKKIFEECENAIKNMSSDELLEREKMLNIKESDYVSNLDYGSYISLIKEEISFLIEIESVKYTDTSKVIACVELNDIGAWAA